MNSLYYLGLDVHKKTISYCLKLVDGSIVAESTVSTQRKSLEAWLRQLPKPWCGAMEATLFTGWIYDFLLPHAKSLQVAHPAMLKAISASKKKNDKVDARMLADLLRCNLLPVCYMAPPELRELRRLLRYRSLMVRQAVRSRSAPFQAVPVPFQRSISRKPLQKDFGLNCWLLLCASKCKHSGSMAIY